MAMLVFISIYVIGNPVDILASPDETERERMETMVASASTSRSRSSSWPLSAIPSSMAKAS